MADDGGKPANGGAAPKTYEEWYATLTDELKGLVEGHISGLKSALERQKTDNKDLKATIAATIASKDTEAASKLEAITGQLKDATQRASFYEAAGKMGVKNAKLAFVAAKDAGLLHEDGTLKEDKFKETFPELIGEQPVTKPQTQAGAGTGGTKTPETMTWNDAVRIAAGVQT